MRIPKYSQQKNGSKKQKISLVLFFSCSVFLFFSISETSFVGAESVNTAGEVLGASTTAVNVNTSSDPEAEALRGKITQKSTELDTLKQQIATYEKQLNFTQGQAQTLQNNVKSLDLERQKMSTDIQLTQKQLDTSLMNLDQLNLGIADIQEKITVEDKALSEIFRIVDRTDERTIVETVLSNDKLSSMMDESMQLMQLREQARNHAKELSTYQNTLVVQKTKVENEKKKLVNYKTALSDQKSVLDIAKKEKADLLKQTKNRETDYQKILNANKAKQDQLEQELTDYESKLTRQLSKSQIPTSGSKILAWPLASPSITQPFGITKDSVRLYASGTHNGIDLRANIGTPITSPASGTVIGVGDTDISCPKASYGKWVLIRHYNGLTTLMGHFSLTKVIQGQEVATGDIIGYSGNTGYSTGPHLHMSVFASDGVQIGSFPSKSCSGKILTMPLPTAKPPYLDPASYLPNL